MLKILLLPVALIYYIVVAVRNFLFDRKFFSTTQFPVKIISVGNLSAGGTGKTPIVMKLAKMYIKAGLKPAIVSRGYRGQYSSESEKVDINRADAALFYGDEPVLMAKNLSVPVYVGRKRVRAVSHLLNHEKDIDVVIADDAFQHRWLSRDKDIVLVDATSKNNLIIPSGRLREPFSSLKRASAIIISKYNLASEAEQKKIVNLLESYGFSLRAGNLFLANYQISCLESVFENSFEQGCAKKVLLLSAIAQPDSFEKMLDKDYEILKHIRRGDHYHWTQQDIEDVINWCSKNECKDIITTEKDAIKLKNIKLEKGFHIWKAKLKVNLQPEGISEFFI